MIGYIAGGYAIGAVITFVSLLRADDAPEELDLSDILIIFMAMIFWPFLAYTMISYALEQRNITIRNPFKKKD